MEVNLDLFEADFTTKNSFDKVLLNLVLTVAIEDCLLQERSTGTYKFSSCLGFIHDSKGNMFFWSSCWSIIPFAHSTDTNRYLVYLPLLLVTHSLQGTCFTCINYSHHYLAY